MNYRVAVLLVAVLGVGYAAGAGVIEVDINTDSVPIEPATDGQPTVTETTGTETAAKQTVVGGVEGGGGVDKTTAAETVGGGPEIDTAAVREEFVEKLNWARLRNGSDEVERNSDLREMGNAHAGNMARHDYIGHEQPDGTTIKDRYQERGLLPGCVIYLPAEDAYYRGAENAAGASLNTPMVADWATGGVYTVRSADELAEFLFEQWIRSPGHKKPMLAQNTEEIGLGLAFDDGEVYAALEFC